MSSRVYVPSSWPGLRDLLLSDGLGPPPILGHAVTDGLRHGFPGAGEEEWEYAALSAAARSSLGLIGHEDPPRRVVVALDADTVLPGVAEDPTVVEVGEAVPLRRVAAVMVDATDAEDDVRAAAAGWAAAEEGDAEAERAVERCLDRDLAWFATQELAELLGD